MSLIANRTSTKNNIAAANFAAVEKQPAVLSNVLSFLTPKERESERLVSKKHDIIATQISKKDVVENGYGDFLLVDTTKGADGINIDQYNEAFPILNDCLAQVSQKPEPNRLQKLNQLLQKKLPHLKAIFIPRVLYELFYLLQGYEEELQLARKQLTCSQKDTCCHSFEFQGKGNENNLDKKVSCLARELNRFIVHEIGLIDTGLTVRQYQRIGKALLDRFEKLNQVKFPNRYVITRSKFPILIKMREGMMIDRANLDKMIALECSQKAENAVILYRGASSKKEPLNKFGDPYTPSFGIGLFAGYIYDINASAAGRIFYDKQTLRSYALAVPLDSNWKDAFDIPPVNTICGLSGYGELFHARAKCLKPTKKIEGYAGIATPEIQARLVSPLKKEELQEKLDSYQAKSIEIIPDPSKKRGNTAWF